MLEDVETPAGQLRIVAPVIGATCCATIDVDGTLTADTTAKRC